MLSVFLIFGAMIEQTIIFSISNGIKGITHIEILFKKSFCVINENQIDPVM